MLSFKAWGDDISIFKEDLSDQQRWEFDKLMESFSGFLPYWNSFKMSDYKFLAREWFQGSIEGCVCEDGALFWIEVLV